IPNVAVFAEQVRALQTLLVTGPPTAAQQQDVDFLFALGELFTLVPYAQLILEQAGIEGTEEFLLDQIFDLFVREFSGHATTLHAKPAATPTQSRRALDLVRRPVADATRFERVVRQVRDQAGRYAMNP
ncbi:acyl-CoA dehydrogenase, partial [Nocardia gipuzkoensis]